MNKQDITGELRKWADAPIKSPAISKVLRAAAKEIERLREQTLQSDTNIVRPPEERSIEDIVERVLALNHPDAADAADEIERLRELVDDMAQHLRSYLCHCNMVKCKCGYDSVMEHYKEVRGER